jgi:hypothetical protein
VNVARCRTRLRARPNRWGLARYGLFGLVVTECVRNPILSRTIAVIVLALPVGWSMADMNETDIARYRSLGHRELMAVLEANHSMGFAGSFAVALAMVGLPFLLVTGLSLGVDRLLGAMARRASPL